MTVLEKQYNKVEIFLNGLVTTIYAERVRSGNFKPVSKAGSD
jgi:hypothetical protein